MGLLNFWEFRWPYSMSSPKSSGCFWAVSQLTFSNFTYT